MPLKLVLIGPEGTLFADGKARTDLLGELVTLIQRLHANGVQVALWSRHHWTLNNEPVEDYLSRASGTPVRLFAAAQGKLPARQFKGSVDPILAELGIHLHEAILVGNGETDFRAGVNNGLLLVRPDWYGSDIEYGFSVSSIGSLARFCELFALRAHPVYWSIDDGSLRVRAMGPFSTYIPDFAAFGANAREVAKQDGGDPRFWFLMIVSTLYFSGLAHEIDYICPFPGHNPTAIGKVRIGFDALMSLFGKCFRKPYLPDFIVRHRAAIKSQSATADQKTFRNQIETIHLTRRPRRYDQAEPPKAPLKLTGKTVLVVDDFCTNGRSLDVARAYIEATGGRAVLFSWLKTINRPFLHMMPEPALDPFQPNKLAEEPGSIEYPYNQYVVDRRAPGEIDAIFNAYKKWKWP